MFVLNQMTKRIAYGALAAALIMVATAFIKVPGPVAGYYHLGDGVIFVMAMLMGAPTAAMAAGIGSALADLMAGYGIYAPVTFVIKAAMGYLAGRYAKGKLMRRIILFALCEVVMVAGYFAFEAVIYGVAVAAANVLFNLIQGAFGIILGACFTGGWMQRFAQSLGINDANGRR